jgi:curli biogenesis system outer membrane secretion channel CsgG
MYVMNVGLDLRLIDSRTLEVVDVVSYQKQIIGRELSAGVFAFFGDVVLDASAGGRSLEPIQLAVRSVVERAVLEISSQLYQVAARAGLLLQRPDRSVQHYRRRSAEHRLRPHGGSLCPGSHEC